MILRGVILVAFLIGASEALRLTPTQTTTTANVGASVVFTCTNTDATGSDIPTWNDKNGYPIRTIDNGGSQDMHVVVYPSEKRTQLNILNIIKEYDGSYGCVLGLESDSRSLRVIEECEFTKKCPTGTNAPPCEDYHQDNQELIIHEADRIECSVKGEPEPEINWTFKSNPISDTDPRYTFQRTVKGEEITHILAIANVTRFDEGVYKCQAAQYDQGIIKNLDITVDVQEPPKIIRPPQDKIGTEGKSITFYCRAEGDPQPDYIWFRGGDDPLENGDKYTLEDSNRELTIKNLVKGDQGDYTCQAKNAAGIDQKAGFLNVFIPPLLNPGENETKSLNQQVELECFLRRGEEDTLLRWRRGEKWLTDGKQDFNERWEVFTRVEQTSTVKILRISLITKEDEGPYTCWGKNEGGEDEIDHWLMVEYKPIIDLDRSPYEVKGWVDNESNMTCHWDAYPQPKVSWTKNGIPLKDGVNATIETEIVIGGVITILYVTPTSKDFGPYECHASNRLGWATHNIVFQQVFGPEVPTNIHVTHTTSTTFTIEVEDPKENGGLRIEGYQVGYHLPNFPEEYQDYNETEPIKVLGLTPERQYFYRVAAVNDVGVGDFSINKTVTTGYYSGLPNIGGEKFSTTVLICIILGAFFFLLILVDISCYFMNSCGFLMCICVHCCGQVPPDEKDDLEMGDGPPGYGSEPDETRSVDPFEVKLKSMDEEYNSWQH